MNTDTGTDIDPNSDADADTEKEADADADADTRTPIFNTHQGLPIAHGMPVGSLIPLFFGD